MEKSERRKYVLPGLGAKLLAARRAAGLTQDAAAKLAAVSRSNLSMYEGESKAPTLPVLAELAKAYRVTLCALLPESNDPPPSAPGSPVPAPRRPFGPAGPPLKAVPPGKSPAPPAARPTGKGTRKAK